MKKSWNSEALILGLLLCGGLLSIGYVLGKSAIQFKEYERTVTVRSLVEREVRADIAIWVIKFIAAHNETEALDSSIVTVLYVKRTFRCLPAPGHGSCRAIALSTIIDTAI